MGTKLRPNALRLPIRSRYIKPAWNRDQFCICDRDGDESENDRYFDRLSKFVLRTLNTSFRNHRSPVCVRHARVAYSSIWPKDVESCCRGHSRFVRIAGVVPVGLRVKYAEMRLAVVSISHGKINQYFALPPHPEDAFEPAGTPPDNPLSRRGVPMKKRYTFPLALLLLFAQTLPWRCFLAIHLSKPTKCDCWGDLLWAPLGRPGAQARRAIGSMDGHHQRPAAGETAVPQREHQILIGQAGRRLWMITSSGAR